MLPCWDIFIQIEIFLISTFSTYCFLCWKSDIWDARHIGMSAILDEQPYDFLVLLKLVSRRYSFSVVTWLLTITVNLSRLNDDLSWIAYFLISVVWRSSFNHVVSMPLCSSVYSLGTVVSFGRLFNGTCYCLLSGADQNEINSHLLLDKMAANSQTTLQTYFIEWKCIDFDWYFTEIYS